MTDCSFEINDVDMFEEFGMMLIFENPQIQPQLRPRKITIPQRSGAYDYGAQYYDERELTLNCYIEGEFSTAQKDELSYLLSKKVNITLWNTPDRYYSGRIYNITQTDPVGEDIMTYIDLTFVCDPFAYGALEEVLFEGCLTPTYNGTASTPTRLDITNNGTVDVSTVRISIRRRRD
jgi:phage-related protein